MRQGEGGTLEIWDAGGTRRNRIRGVDEVVHTLGLHARQAGLLAISGEANPTYAHDTTLALSITPMVAKGGCPRTPFEDPEGPVWDVAVPMCNAVQLEIELGRQPVQPLHLSILYLSNDGSITVWPPAGTIEVARDRGDRFVQPLGWVGPPLDSPDRILVFGTHEDVDFSMLVGEAVAEARTRGGGLQAFLADHLAGTRGIDEGPPMQPGSVAWTSSYLQLRVVGDPARWSDAERTDRGICAARRAAEAAAGACPD